MEANPIDLIHDELVQFLVRQKRWKDLRTVQKRAIPPILSGSNVLITSSTASGKTEAATLPILSIIAQTGKEGLQCLYVAPLVALLNDLEGRIGEYCGAFSSGIPRIFKWHGDVQRAQKIRNIEAGFEILLTTPESLEVILMMNPEVLNQEQFFHDLGTVIIDEVHSFIAGGRGCQLSSILERLKSLTNSDFQRIGLSATVSDSSTTLSWLSGSSPRDAAIIEGETSSRKRHVIINYYGDVEEDDLAGDMLETTERHLRVLFFCKSRHQTEDLLTFAKTEGSNRSPSSLYAHHSCVARQFREKAEHEMKIKPEFLTFCTSSLELGIDIGNVEYVCMASGTGSVSSFEQRIGRIRSGLQGCTLFLFNEDEFLISLSAASLASERLLESIHVSNRAYHILLQQILCQAVFNYGIGVEVIRDLMNNCPSFERISDEDFQTLIQHACDLDILHFEDGQLLIGIEAQKAFAPRNYLELYSVFKSPKQYEVVYQSESIGQLDMFFVESKNLPFTFALAGKWWTAWELNRKTYTLWVKPGVLADAPVWAGHAGGRVSELVAQRVKEILLNDSFGFREIEFSKDSADVLRSLRTGASMNDLYSESPAFRISNDRLRIVTFAGTVINDTIGYWCQMALPMHLEESDYIGCEFKLSRKTNGEDSCREFMSFLSNLDQIDIRDVQKELTKQLPDRPFEKFTEYVHSSLLQKYRTEFSIDLEKTLPYLRRLKQIY